MMKNDNFYYGISGLNLPVPKNLYPAEFQDKSRLEYYAFLFNSLEINSSFYKLPQIKTVQKWVDMVPNNFRFTFKLSKTITHNKGLVFKDEDVELSFKAITPAASKKGCLLIQFPPSLKIDLINEFQELLKTLTFYNDDDWNLAVEFRHFSWYEREVFEIAQEYNACIVSQDIPASATPAEFVKSDVVYLRFHGPEPRYRGSYSQEFLSEVATKIKQLQKENKMVYCYFNNTMGAAVNNLQTLLTLMKKI